MDRWGGGIRGGVHPECRDTTTDGQGIRGRGHKNLGLGHSREKT